MRANQLAYTSSPTSARRRSFTRVQPSRSMLVIWVSSCCQAQTDGNADETRYFDAKWQERGNGRRGSRAWPRPRGGSKPPGGAGANVNAAVVPVRVRQ